MASYNSLMSDNSHTEYPLNDSFERSTTSSSCRKTAYSMLNAKLPTQKELGELYRELETMRKDKKLKDDTIKFLQKEKEGLMRELKHYEQICDGVVSDVSANRELEAQNKQLQADILHLKDVISRQNLLLRNTGTSSSTHLDRQLITRLCGNLMGLLGDAKTMMSTKVYKEIEHQKEVLERSSSKRSETIWRFLEVIDRAMIELKSVQKINQDLPDITKPALSLKYSQGNPGYPSSTNEHNMRPPQTNLTTTNSASFANLSSTETLLMAGHARKRTSNNNTGKLGRLGRLERSRSAPALNGKTPHPPNTPIRSTLGALFSTPAVSAMETVVPIKISGMVPRPPTSPAPSHLKTIYKSSDQPLKATVNMLDTLVAHPPGVDY